MGAFPAPNGNVWLVRNHELNGTAAAATGPGTPYDSRAPAVITSVRVTPFGEVLEAFTSLNGTQNNCAGGVMPWGTWITCEETVNGPDVGPDFTGASNVPLQRRHGFIFEVPAGGQSNRQPITSAGRFAHEGAAWNQKERALYLTEDNFAFPSGFYRYLPPTDPMKTGSLANGGRLQMLRVVGQTNAHLEANQANGATYEVDWVDIADPNPTFPSAGDDDTTRHSSTSATRDGRRAPRTSRASRARRSRRTGSTSRRRRAADPPRRVPSSSSATGGESARSGRTTRRSKTLECVFQSPSAAVLELPDNVTHSSRGTIVICEDGPVDNYVRGLTKQGELFDIALNRLRRNAPPNAARFGEEFAGATFSPNGRHAVREHPGRPGDLFAIWGPWGRIGV